MQYALVNGERQEARRGLTGKCELHGCPVIAKCGEVNIWHWAHIGKLICDPWRENQTEWHRAWKGRFPKECQEITHFAKNGEKHIADVKTAQAYVIEFQHSHLDPKERVIRETFYQNMIWVVDGTRLKKDYPRFLEGRKNFTPTPQKGIFLVHFPEECFPSAWVESSVEVIFDFQGSLPTDPQDWMRNILWCLLPGRARRRAVVIAVSRQDFVSTAMKQPRLLPDPAHELVSAFDKLLTEQEELREQQSQKQELMPRKRTWRL
jgi:competence protein CoiA